MKSEHPNTIEAGSGRLKPLGLALVIGAGLGVGGVQAQTIEVGGAATIGDSVLTTSSGVAKVPATGANWTASGGNGNTFSSLISPGVTVANTGSVTLTFTHRYDFENTWDGGGVYVNVNGGGFVKVDLASFSSNGYNGTAVASVWPLDEEIFTGTSTDYGVPTLITSVADLGSLIATDTVSVEFRGGWDGNTNGADPNWEIGTVQISDTGATLLDADFTVDGASGFTASFTGTGNSPWEYNATSISRFELDADTDTADRYAPDIAGSVIDLNGASIEVALLNGTLASSDVFSLFDLSGGTTLSGSINSIALPANTGIWDTSLLETAGTITLTTAFTPADGLWITDGDGSWIDAANWDSSTMAYGTDQTADFTVATSADRTVTLNADITIGNIIKDDTSGDNDRLIFANGNTLTLDVTSGSPVITNSDPGSGERFEIDCPIASSDGLTKDGPGYVLLNNTSSSWTGDTTISEGMLQTGSIPLANIGGGSGRNITVADGAAIQRTWTILDNGFLNRLVETSDTIGVFLSATGGSYNTNDLDFSSSTGANLPNAFLGVYATNGAKSQYDGTITPASDNYRLGHPLQGGSLHIRPALPDVGGTPRGLIVGGGAVIIAGDNTFTGDTVLQGGRLFLGRQLCLQNSALNVGNGVDGNVGTMCFLSSGGGGVSTAQLTDEPTLGGLIGSRNLASIYSSANQNNTSRLAIGSVLGITLDVDGTKTHTYSGNARLSSGMYLTKTGLGTQVLSGANDYTGATSVDEGTLALVGGSQASPITVTTGASLDFTLGSTTASSSTVDLTNGTVKITGAVDNSSDYQLMTASGGFTFTDPLTQLDSPITDYELQLQNTNTELWLVFTGGGGTDYATWAAGFGGLTDPAVGLDFDDGGLDSGIEYVLGGDPTDGSDDAGLAPTVSEDGSNLIFTFTRDQDSIVAGTAVTIEVGTDLATWPDSYAVPDVATAGPPVEVVDNLDGTDTVTLTVAQSPDVKKFARLNVVITP